MGDVHHIDLGSYEKSGIQLTSKRLIAKWMKRAGLVVDHTRLIVPAKAQPYEQVLGSLLATDLVVVGRRIKSKSDVALARVGSENEGVLQK